VARAWLRTPYHHMGRVKGGGVDRATLPAEVYARAGVVPALAIPFYPPDWHLHRNAERLRARGHREGGVAEPLGGAGARRNSTGKR
jgi:hypothetical protein